MRRHIHTFLLLLAMLLIAQPPVVLAEDDPNLDVSDMSIDELMAVEVTTVVGASKFEQKLSEAPSSVSIVTAEDIKRYGYRTLADILRSVRGVYVTYDRAYSYVGVRGFNRPGDYSTRILILINGHRFNDNIYDQAATGTEFALDADIIDRVEIIRGPGSSLYGANAFFAVVNVITRTGSDMSGAEISGEAASLGTYKGRLSYGRLYDNGLSVLLSVSAYDSRGDRSIHYEDYDDPATNDGVAEGLDGDSDEYYYARLAYRNLTLEVGSSDRDKHFPTASYGVDFNDARTRDMDDHDWVDLRYTQPVGKSELTARLYWDSYLYEAYLPYDDVTNYDLGEGRWWGFEVLGTVREWDRQVISLGAEYRDNYHQLQKNYDIEPHEEYLDVKQSSSITGLFLQDDITVSEKVRANVGVRYDNYSTFGGTTNPRAALIVKPYGQGVVKLLYGQAFRSPNFYEMYYDAYGYRENPDLEPETIKTYELVYEQPVAEGIRLTLNGYYNEIDKLITQVTDPADDWLIYVNVGSASGWGLEGELEGVFAGGIRGRLSYAYQETRDEDTDEILTNSPRNMAKCNVSVPFWGERLIAGAEAQYMSGMRTTRGETDSFTVVNLSILSRKLVPGLEASLSVYNLLDASYSYPVSEEILMDSIEQDGRALRLKATYRF